MIRCFNRFGIIVLSGIEALAPATAQNQHNPAMHQQPYAGLETRGIKALSPAQIEDLKAGRGMGLALAAELNGYPGPSHVLELADALALTPAQKSAVTKLFEDMKREAIAAGERVIAAETDLDQRFASAKIDEASLATAVMGAGHANMELRRTHLKFHLSTRAVLSDAQRAAYAKLRGYGG